MKQQIKKLCKQLKRFDFDDILSILELPEDEVQTIKILKDVAKENPDYKMGYSTYLKWKSAYFRQGLTGLLKAYPQPKNKSLTTKELLDEFEKIYLTPKRYSARIAWEILTTGIYKITMCMYISIYKYF